MHARPFSQKRVAAKANPHGSIQRSNKVRSTSTAFKAWILLQSGSKTGWRGAPGSFGPFRVSCSTDMAPEKEESCSGTGFLPLNDSHCSSRAINYSLLVALLGTAVLRAADYLVLGLVPSPLWYKVHFHSPPTGKDGKERKGRRWM